MTPAERTLALQKAHNLLNEIDSILADVLYDDDCNGIVREDAMGGDVCGIVRDEINALM